VAASAGATCHSDTVEISHVLQAMNIPPDWAKGTLRFSVGPMTTVEQIDKAIQVVVHAVKKLQSAPLNNHHSRYSIGFLYKTSL